MTSDAKSGEEKPAAETNDPERHDYLLFRIGGESFAVVATSLRQILEPPGIVGVPNAPGHLLGIINLRGEILAVLDLRGLFDLGPASSHDDDRLIVLKYERRSVAIVADEVSSIEAIHKSKVEPVPLDLPELHRRTFIGQVHLDDGATTSIMDPTALFLLPQFAVHTKGGGGRAHG